MPDGTFSPPGQDRAPVRSAAARGTSPAGHGAARQPQARPGLYRRYGKRLLDIFLVVLALPAVLPVILIAALAIGRAPFYSQDRIGRNGRIFRLWKLRSMVPAAERALETYLASHPARRAEWDRNQKLDPDPRITRVGALLRKTSLDELPQLWNVLIGDMSLVGPRPMMPDQRALYPGSGYYRLRPGLTGPWQVSDRNAVSFSARAEFDDAYERRLSFGQDLTLIARTGWIVLRATGK